MTLTYLLFAGMTSCTRDHFNIQNLNTLLTLSLLSIEILLDLVFLSGAVAINVVNVSLADYLFRHAIVAFDLNFLHFASIESTLKRYCHFNGKNDGDVF